MRCLQRCRLWVVPPIRLPLQLQRAAPEVVRLGQIEANFHALRRWTITEPFLTAKLTPRLSSRIGYIRWVIHTESARKTSERSDPGRREIEPRHSDREPNDPKKFADECRDQGWICYRQRLAIFLRCCKRSWCIPHRRESLGRSTRKWQIHRTRAALRIRGSHPRSPKRDSQKSK